MTQNPSGLNEEQQKVLDHHQSLCLSAGAGSGKTRTLVEKYIHLLAVDDLRPSDILAITFTEKAAAEMQTRIRRTLRAMIQAETDEVRCGELEDKLMMLGGGWISTIHSFGARVLREHPAEAGIDPGFTPLPEQESQILWETAALNAVSEMSERDPAVGEITLRMGLAGGRRGASLVSWMLSAKSQMEAMGRRPEDINIGSVTPDRAIDTIRLKGALDEILNVPEPGKTLTARAGALRALRTALDAKPLEAAHSLRLLAKAGWDPVHERIKPGGTLKKNEKEIFIILETESRAFAADAAAALESQLTATFTRLLCAMWSHAEREKARRRSLDFADLEMKLHELFQSHPLIAEKYHRRFKHVLVDEYQDVNIVQAGIIRAIVGDPPIGLFAVGDPKQSIYRFRGADIEQFQTLWRDMEKRGSSFHLKRNYRSDPRIVHAVNALFDGRIFQADMPVEMVAAHPAGTDTGRARIQWWSFKHEDELSSQRRENEARILTDGIRRMIRESAGTEKPLEFGDFTMLFRATTSLFLYEEALRKERIPYELIKAGTAFRSQEVFDVLNAVTVAVDPSDSVAWLGFLRSPMAGLSDNAIFSLSRGRELHGFFIHDIEFPPDLSPEDREAAKWARQLAAAAAEHRRNLSPAAFLEWLLRETGYPVILNGLPQSEARMRYVDALRTLATGYEQRRPDPYVAFLEAAWRMVDRSERETGADAGAENKVKLMTIHQAKGLEFPVVILPDLVRSENTTAPDVFVTPSEDDRHVELAIRVKPAGTRISFKTPRWNATRQDWAARESEEQKRLLYVAMTRAEQYLVISGPDQVGGSGRSLWGLISDFLKEPNGFVETYPMIVSKDREEHSEETILTRIPATRMEHPPAVPTADYPIYCSARAFGADAAKPPAATVRKTGGTKMRGDGHDAMAVELGVLAHEMLQRVDLSLPAQKQVAWMDEELDTRLLWVPLPPKLADSLRENLTRFFHTPLAERLRTSWPSVRREYPFTCILTGDGGGGAPSIGIRGVVDLLVLNRDDALIVDYKYMEPSADFGANEGQMMIYAMAACRAFDLPRIDTGIQFLTGKQTLIQRPITRTEAETYVSGKRSAVAETFLSLPPGPWPDESEIPD